MILRRETVIKFILLFFQGRKPYESHILPDIVSNVLMNLLQTLHFWDKFLWKFWINYTILTNITILYKVFLSDSCHMCTTVHMWQWHMWVNMSIWSKICLYVQSFTSLINFKFKSIPGSINNISKYFDALHIQLKS